MTPKLPADSARGVGAGRPRRKEAARMMTLPALEPDALRAAGPAWIGSHLAEPQAARGAEEAVRAVLDAAPDAELRALGEAFASAGQEYRFYPANPLARRVSRAFLPFAMTDATLEGVEHLEAFLSGGPARRIIVGNHLSYVDTQLTDALLVAHGHAAVADRIVAIAGPKVYTDPFRRIAAIGLHTRKTAQSGAVATEQALLSPRELAAVALETLADCESLMDDGFLPLLYPEGTRTRTGRLQPFLRASARYLAVRGVRALPIALSGSDAVFPRDATRISTARVTLRVGAPFEAATFAGGSGLAASTAALEEAHARIAALLPPDARPLPDAARVG
jgi:1-acyl-sn-glycerol-3-phosphate acyltransferase